MPGSVSRAEVALLRDHLLLRRAAGLAGARGEHDPRHDLLGDRLLAVQPVLERRPHLGVDRGEDLGVVQPILGLALELRLLDEDAEHGDQALADVLGGERHALRRQVVRLDVVADRLAEAGAEAVLVRAAGAGGDAVDVAADVLVGRLGPLQRELDADVAVAPVAGQRERRLVDGALLALDDQPVQVGGDAVFVDEGVARAGRLLDEGQLEAAVQVARRLEALAHQRGVELDAREDRRVGMELDGGAGAARRAGLHQVALRHALLEALFPRVAVAPDGGDQSFDSALTTLAPTPCRPPAVL